MNFHLLVHNTVAIASAIAIVGITLLIFINSSRQKKSNTPFTLMLLSVAVFVVSHAIGVNIDDPGASRAVLMFNLSIMFAGAFNVHGTLILIGKQETKRWLTTLLYSSATALTVFFILNPDLFLMPSVPKMYFPNYYEPGSVNIVRLLFLYGICLLYLLYELVRAYLKTQSGPIKNQLKYLVGAQVVGHVIGFIPNFLVYNIPFDPLWGMAFGALFSVPLLYGTVKYGLLNVKVIAKQAAFYSIAFGSIGGIIFALFYLNHFIESIYPSFPLWITALASAFPVMIISVLVWRRLRESDILKYEFINIITHKFRTPMTYINFSVDELRANPSHEMVKTAIDRIELANNRLVELTNTLAEAASVEAKEKSYSYTFHALDLTSIIEEVVTMHRGDFAAKLLSVKTDYAPGLPLVRGDRRRLTSVIQTLIENAVMYSVKGGAITIRATSGNNRVTVSVQDDGIGITREELRLIFSKFFRTQRAFSKDTEGMGVGLFIAKNIVEQHGGKIWAESGGEGKGSTFSVSVPVSG